MNVEVEVSKTVSRRGPLLLIELLYRNIPTHPAGILGPGALVDSYIIPQHRMTPDVATQYTCALDRRYTVHKVLKYHTYPR